MKDIIIGILVHWNDEKNQRTKLQQAYFCLIFGLAVVSGLITLLSSSSGQSIMIIAAVFAGVYLINGIVWTLLDGVVVSRINSLKKSQPHKK